MLRSKDIDHLRRTLTKVRKPNFRLVLFRNEIEQSAQEVYISVRQNISQDLVAPSLSSELGFTMFGPLSLDIQVNDRFDYNGQNAIITNVNPRRLLQAIAYGRIVN